MKEYKPIHIIFLVVFIIGAVAYIIYDQNRAEEISKQISEEYPLIKKEESVSGKITDIFVPEGFRDDPYGATVIINNSMKKSLSSYSEPQGFVVDDVLHIGSYIEKKAGSKVLIIYNINNSDTAKYEYNLDYL